MLLWYLHPAIRRRPFATETIQRLTTFVQDGPAGNRWYKVNLHVHGQGNDPGELVAAARAAEIDLFAITDHQSFAYYSRIAIAASTPGRKLVVLPGIEITALEGAHVLAIFPADFSEERQMPFYGWLEIPGTGQTTVASKRNVGEIFEKVERELGGVIVIPHPFADNIGLLSPARKISTKEEWLASGHIKFFQLSDNVRDKVRYLGHDDSGSWINRYVLSSASPRQVEDSTYCLAPFNRSDAKRPSEIGDGCSWFRMEQPCIEGLKQVACEPNTRVACQQPAPCSHDAILGLAVSGGYCDGQFFQFSDLLTSLVGPNHAGKSSVLDFIRFALAQEEHCSSDSRGRLLARLNGILQPGGRIELYVRKGCELYLVQREFNPQYVDDKVVSCPDASLVYRFESGDRTLSPVTDFCFPVEVYEQGRIGQLRDDVPRQLEMLDDFAGVVDFKTQRKAILTGLRQSAEQLKPLYEERETLRSDIAQLSVLQQELATKKKLLPDTEEQGRWSNAQAVADALQEIETQLHEALLAIPEPDQETEPSTDLEQLFGQTVPTIDSTRVAKSDVLVPWLQDTTVAINEIETARSVVANAIRKYETAAAKHRARWKQHYDQYIESIRSKLTTAGLQSPTELLNRIAVLDQQITNITTKKQPRLTKLNEQIQMLEVGRSNHLIRLKSVDAEITLRRTTRAVELTTALAGQIQIAVEPAGDRAEYSKVLNDLCAEVVGRQHRIQNREGQLQLVVNSVLPIDLAEALQNDGRLPGGSTDSLESVCQITPNTQKILCSIANDILLLNRLQTVAVPDVPRINVRRRGETSYADLRTGLSQGEQSAAILTLALETRAMPLILDQPEDELGYSYVVHLIVPKVLQAKFSRQLITVTHNANIPVLGDADLVIKMDNKPKPTGGRVCIVTESGCFECASVTNALIELEGGQRAFQFRQHRYALPRA